MSDPISQWLIVVGLAVLTGIVPEVDKWIRRRRNPAVAMTDVRVAVQPTRAQPVVTGA